MLDIDSLVSITRAKSFERNQSRCSGFECDSPAQYSMRSRGRPGLRTGIDLMFLHAYLDRDM